MTTTSATEYLYLSADNVRVGDTLPTVSRQPVTKVTVFNGESVRIVFGGGDFTRHVAFGGPEYGFESFRVERTSL